MNPPAAEGPRKPEESSRARLFAAVELPESVREALARWAASVVAGRPAQLRAVPSAALHVTLCFLGARPLAEVDALGQALRALGDRGAPLLRLGEALWLPPRRPGVLALALREEDGRLAALQADLAGALAALDVYRLERRPFRPHVTVARVRRGSRIDAARPELPLAPASEAWPASELTLFRSHLTPAGSHYEPLRTVRLAEAR